MTPDVLPPRGSGERRQYERLGGALLSDDGRIVAPPQAKTIAIEALARRMRTPTIELVLAATGLIVGSDMAGRLGDGRYVLVPFDEHYPSKGADLLHADELRSELYRPHAHRAIRMDTAEAERLVRTIATSELMRAWSYGSSNNPRSLALQEVARDEFALHSVRGRHLDGSTRSAVDLELKYNRNALTEFLRTQYAMTQEVLHARGISELISYRAYIWTPDGKRPAWAGHEGTVVETRQRPLASWSPDRQMISAWLRERPDHGVILAARHAAQDIVSLPVTGMGLLDHKRWVTLPGNHRAVVDSTISDPHIAEPASPARILTAVPDHRVAGWGPVGVAARVGAPDALDVRIGRILDGREEAPSWWLRDDSGYAITRRDLEFLRIEPQQVRWMLNRQAPMGLTPRLYHQFGSELGDALQLDRVTGSQVDIRLKGTAAGFFSGLHKTLPSEAELAGKPAALRRLRQWFGDDEHRPLRRPYDAMYRLGLEREPSDYDLDINSTTAVRAARGYWRDHYRDRYPGDFMTGHGYLDKQAVRGALPHVSDWATRWEDKLGRPLSLGVFESTGPFDEASFGRTISEHFRDSDWIVHHRQEVAGPSLARPQHIVSSTRPEHLRRASGKHHAVIRS
ncbi:hypothetical protein [Kribbella sp. NPDC048928]|uniref:hypothetical protein n=1 Tax=Kribbella sp. NPDC048928 TaxID=3364111 RepID=UPI003712D3D5